MYLARLISHAIVLVTLLVCSTMAVTYRSRLCRVVIHPLLPDAYSYSPMMQMYAQSLALCAYTTLQYEGIQALVFNSSNNMCALYNSTLMNIRSSIDLSTSNLTYVYIEREEVDGNSQSHQPISTDSTLEVTVPMVAKDCQELYENGIDTSGVYGIRIDELGALFNVWCDFDGEHGWTIIQQRGTGTMDFQKDWDEYKHGFGDVNAGEFWLGNDKIYELTKSNRILNVYMTTANGTSYNANYSSWYIENEASCYRLMMDTITGNYTGDVEDLLSYHNGQCFTTKDRDQDNDFDENCALFLSGGWWYDFCTVANLNGKMSAGYPQGCFWGDFILSEVKMRLTRD